jgi:hypothetical protein
MIGERWTGVAALTTRSKARHQLAPAVEVAGVAAVTTRSKARHQLAWAVSVAGVAA